MFIPTEGAADGCDPRIGDGDRVIVEILYIAFRTFAEILAGVASRGENANVDDRIYDIVLGHVKGGRYINVPLVGNTRFFVGLLLESE